MTVRVDYASVATPPGYVCGGCGATGIKLWREYQTFDPALECATCACASQRKENNVDGDGRRQGDGCRTDQIGWRVPAIPDEDGAGYWGYSSVPAAGIMWWRRLPTVLDGERAISGTWSPTVRMPIRRIRPDVVTAEDGRRFVRLSSGTLQEMPPDWDGFVDVLDENTLL